MLAEVGSTVAYWWHTPGRLSKGVVLSVDRSDGTHKVECRRRKRWELARPERRRQVHTVFHAQIVEIISKPDGETP